MPSKGAGAPRPCIFTCQLSHSRPSWVSGCLCLSCPYCPHSPPLRELDSDPEAGNSRALKGPQGWCGGPAAPACPSVPLSPPGVSGQTGARWDGRAEAGCPRRPWLPHQQQPRSAGSCLPARHRRWGPRRARAGLGPKVGARAGGLRGMERTVLGGGRAAGRGGGPVPCSARDVSLPEALGLASSHLLKFLTLNCSPLPGFAFLGPGWRPGSLLCAPWLLRKGLARALEPPCPPPPPTPPPPCWRGQRGSSGAPSRAAGGRGLAGTCWLSGAGAGGSLEEAETLVLKESAWQGLCCVLAAGRGRRPEALPGLVPHVSGGRRGPPGPERRCPDQSPLPSPPSPRSPCP